MSALAFEVPPVQPARERDHVRMLVASRAGISHHRFLDLPDLLEPGDLLVVNTSATLPAALAGSPRVHLSTPLPGDWPEDGYERWVIELREGDARHRGGRAGQRIALPGGGEAELLAPYLGGRRLWAARLRLPAPLLEYLAAHGEPIRYRHQPEPRPLADYQTIFASASPAAPRCRAPGGRSASASWSGSRSAGSRSPRSSCTPASRRSSAASGRTRSASASRRATLAAVRAARRVIAVGTTVVRALETAAAGVTEGWTRLVVEPDRIARAIPARWSTASSPAGTSPTPATC